MKRADLIDYLRVYVGRKCPPYPEIAAYLGASPDTMRQHAKRAVDAGQLAFDGRRITRATMTPIVVECCSRCEAAAMRASDKEKEIARLTEALTVQRAVSRDLRARLKGRAA